MVNNSFPDHQKNGDKRVKGYILLFSSSLVLFLLITGLFFLWLYEAEKFAQYGILSAYIGSLIIVLSAGMAGYLTIKELEHIQSNANEDRKSSNQTSRLRATLDTIMTTELDNDFIEAKVIYQKYANSPHQDLEKLFARVYDGMKHNYVKKGIIKINLRSVLF